MKYTEDFDLTTEEVKAAERIAKSLTKNCIGKKNAVHRDVLIEKLASAKNSFHTDKVKLFEIMQYIRVHQLCGSVIESNQSYYISEDTEEIKQYCLYLESRIFDIKRIQAALWPKISMFETNNKQ